MRTLTNRFLQKSALLLSLFVFCTQKSLAQDCTASIIYTLKNVSGGFFTGQTVTLTSRNDGEIYTQKSDASGKVTFEVPCEQLFDVTVTNYTKPEETSSGTEGSQRSKTLGYNANMQEKDAVFAMTTEEKTALDSKMRALPDTTILLRGFGSKPAVKEDYEKMTVTIKDLNDGPLKGESFVISGKNRNKHFLGNTSDLGQITLYVPKGDDYTISFKHHTDYQKFTSDYKNGTATAQMNFTYIGTYEFEKRKKEEEERILAEEKRLAEEKIEFEKYCKERKLSLEEGFKAKLKESAGSSEENIIDKVFRRNKWSEKLIVCDLTGSMDPYAQQLSVWYQLNYKVEPNLQFVFFNDGDEKEDNLKVIGSTGGIYYQNSKGLDSLISIMSTVRANGSGGDCPENNMEALITGVKRAKPYKELIMIVDNNAPVKDIELLKSFNKPVHIILCGSVGEEIEADYLKIAWKTKGSIHTMEEDIVKIASMAEGQTIQIGGYTYKILGGEFVRITKT